MEFVDGEDLAGLLRRIGRLPQEKATQVAREMAAGLAAAHEQGILHRDLKPANMLLDGRGHVRLTDFGLAALRASVSGAELRSGTPVPELGAWYSGPTWLALVLVMALALYGFRTALGRRPAAMQRPLVG